MGMDEKDIEGVARVCHAANRAYCMMIGDNSQMAWADAPEWQKTSAISGVKFHLMNPDAKPEDSHKSWFQQKEADGWKYGPEKNPETKEHPCMVPFDQLPMAQQKKDHLFIGIVRALGW